LRKKKVNWPFTKLLQLECGSFFFREILGYFHFTTACPKKPSHFKEKHLLISVVEVWCFGYRFVNKLSLSKLENIFPSQIFWIRIIVLSFGAGSGRVGAGHPHPPPQKKNAGTGGQLYLPPQTFFRGNRMNNSLGYLT